MLCIYSVYVYMYECWVFFCIIIIIMLWLLKQHLDAFFFDHQLSSTCLSNISLWLFNGTGSVCRHLINRQCGIKFSIGAKLTDLYVYIEFDVWCLHKMNINLFVCWTSNKKLSILISCALNIYFFLNLPAFLSVRPYKNYFRWVQ